MKHSGAFRVMFETGLLPLRFPIMPTLSIPEARKIIFSQEDTSLALKRAAWNLFRHEIERPDPKTKRAVSPRRALGRVLAWMIIQKEKEARSAMKLNPIQKKILYLLAVEGYTQAQAAIELNRAHETVKKDCARLREQLGVDSILQVVAIAVEKGWIPAPSPNPQRGRDRVV